MASEWKIGAGETNQDCAQPEKVGEFQANEWKLIRTRRSWLSALARLSQSANVVQGMMMKRCLSVVFVCLLIVGYRISHAKAEDRSIVDLKPDAAKSFATPITPFVIGIIGTNWALEIHAAWPPGSVPPAGASTNGTGFLLRGAKAEQYVRPPAGPARPWPPPETPGYTSHAVSNVVLTAIGGRFVREPEGYLDVAVSEFEADGIRFRIGGVLRLRVRGPYP